MIIRIDDIKIGHRHRKDRHDPTLYALADSIKAQGLLQPIGVTEDNELVFGWRRLQAVQLAPLWWQEIEARVVNVTSIVEGEFAENEMRKNFTMSERTAIMKTIKRLSEGRRYNNSKDLLSYDEAAQKAGFGNATTAREAFKIVEDGVEELVEAVDRGDIAINAGSFIAREAPEVQRKIVRAPEKQRRKAVKQLRDRRSPAPRVSKPYVRTEPLRKPLTPQEVDPEFTGTPMEFTDKYGHVQIMTAEQYATMRFTAWAGNVKNLAKHARSLPDWPAVDHNWLRSPDASAVARLTEALEYLRPKIAEAEKLLERAVKALQTAHG